MNRTRLPLAVAGVAATVVFELLAIVRGDGGNTEPLRYEVHATVQSAKVAEDACGQLAGVEEVQRSDTSDLPPGVPAEGIDLRVEGRTHTDAVAACLREQGAGDVVVEVYTPSEDLGVGP